MPDEATVEDLEARVEDLERKVRALAAALLLTLSLGAASLVPGLAVVAFPVALFVVAALLIVALHP